VLPGLVARPAQQGAPTVAANDTRISDLERKVAALELAQANAYGQVLVHLADVRGDVKVVNSEITALASALRSR